ncbi:Serine/threonine-protein kinase CTR1 (Protein CONSTITUTIVE TRIPLE RESPONSE1) [Durusdinium trenchii]|uniref:Serine/threonine-protein kinase CTR1 (Protein CONSTITUTIVE TRIPLE RESPONSE1) n=1 Tax=Durusdinium trenchii TaxID=1381693 RepID=A0ABP0L0D8_9DINO
MFEDVTHNISQNLEARKLYEQVVSSHPSSAEAHLRLAEFAQEADDAQEAYRIALQAVKVAPRDAAAHLSLGHASSKLGRADEAVRALEQVAVLQPSALDVPAMIALAESYKKAGREQEAIRYYKRVLDSRPDDYECTLSLAQLHADRGPGGASQAVHYFRTALKCRPTTVDARSIYLQMATVQCAISAWKDAKATLEGAVHELPEDAEMWQKLLSICEQLKDSKGQHHCHRRLVQLGATTAASQIMYASLLMSEDRLREAKELLNQVIKAEPKNAAALLKLAQCLKQDGSRDGNLEEALRLFEQVLQLSPNNLEALEGAAYCNRKSNKLDQAVQLYQQCLKVNASAESPLYYLGDILYRQHRHAECQAYLSRLVASNCGEDYKTGALYLLAKSHISLDEHEEAEKQARSGLTLKPNHPHFLFILALVKNRMGDFDASITTLKKAFQHLGVDSDNLKVEIHDWLAQAYERKGEYTNASAELAMALKQDPSHVSSLITQGVIHMQLKKLEEAETSFRRALAIVKNHALALVRLGYCKLLCADSQEAILLFQRALQQRCGTVALPRSVKGCARIYMALALMGKQDPDGALHQIAEARKSHRNFDQLCSFGKDSIVKGQCDDLVDKLKSVPDLDITLAQAWQLVELLAKEVEVGLGDRGKTPTAGSTESPSGESQLQSQAQGATPERRAWVATPTPSTATPSSERRQWTSPSPATPAAAPPAVPKAEAADKGKKLLLHKHEMIDFNQLVQRDCLGSGGFGAVYRGYLGSREVAIKKLFCEDGGNISPLQLEELEKEVAALRSLNHPRLVSFIGACLQPPNICIVTEFMAGGSLHHLLHKARTPLTLGTQSKMALQVCEGVDFLHGHSPPVVHRDLKSLNIVLDRIYNAKICDFGLTQSMEKTHITLKEGGNGGSPRYMAPECYDCKGKITEKVDVWALGLVPRGLPDSLCEWTKGLANAG